MTLKRKKKNKKNKLVPLPLLEPPENVSKVVVTPSELVARDAVCFNAPTVDKTLVLSSKLHHGFPVSQKYSGKGLRKVLIGPDVEKIAFKSFMDTGSLLEVQFIMNTKHNVCAIKEVGNLAFKGCKNLSIMALPDSIRKIGSKAFLACSYLNRVSIPSCLVTLESEVFRDCAKLPFIIMPWNMEEIKNRCFYQCAGLHTVILPYKLRGLGDEVFTRCALKTCILPTHLQKWGSQVFAECHGLNLIVPDHLAENNRFKTEIAEGVDDLMLVSYSDFLRGQGFILSDEDEDVYPLVLFLYQVLKEGKLFHAQELVDRFYDHRSLFDRAVTHVFPVVDQEQKRHIDLAKRYFASVFDPFSGFFTVREVSQLLATNKEMHADKNTQALINQLMHKREPDKNGDKPTSRF